MLVRRHKRRQWARWNGIAREISGRIKYELGITVSIGVSWNKIFAKLGSGYKKPDAITRIGRDNYREIAWPLPAGDLLYVGSATLRKLESYGIHTIGNLARTPERTLRGWFGKWGEVLYRWPRHFPCRSISAACQEHWKLTDNTARPED